MKNLCILLAVIMSLSVAAFVHADAGADTPQSLYLKAAKEERQGETAKACQTYETIIDRFPDSEFAVKANDRLLTISPRTLSPAATPPAVTIPPQPLAQPAPQPVPQAAQQPLPQAAPQPAPQAAPQPAPQGAPQAGSQPPGALVIPLPSLLTPDAPAPLPADPVKSRGVELARQYQKARYIHDTEYERREFAFTTQYGHRYNRADLSRKQKEWQKSADDRVMKELGMSLKDARLKLYQACVDAGITGTCDEDAFRK
jgi:hypothetical protein